MRYEMPNDRPKRAVEVPFVPANPFGGDYEYIQKGSPAYDEEQARRAKSKVRTLEKRMPSAGRSDLPLGPGASYELYPGVDMRDLGMEIV